MAPERRPGRTPIAKACVFCKAMAGGHIFRRWLLVILVAVLALPPQTVTVFAQQERGDRPNLLELLFGGGRRNIDRDRSIVDMPQRRQRQQRQKQRPRARAPAARTAADRKSTRLNSSHY